MEKRVGRYFNVRVTEKERELFVDAARELDVPHCLLIRRLMRYALKKEVDLLDLLRESQKLSVPGIGDEYEKRKKTMRTQLAPDIHTSFTGLAKDWGMTANALLRRLIWLYIAGKIERHAIL